MDTKAEVNLKLEMSTDETVEWLTNTVGLTRYAEVFKSMQIDGIMLANIEEQDLINELGVSSRLHRVKILGEI